MTNIFSVLCLLFFVSFFVSPSLVLCAGETDNKWSYSIENDVETSERSYLLVHLPTTKEERRINVKSRCQKPYPSEGAYGKCIHKIEIQPTNKKFTLNTGEDVVMISFTWNNPLILGTIEYGCCGGQDIVRFYTENNDYLGYIEKFNISKQPHYNNLILRTFDMGNATRDGSKIYMLMKKDNNHDLLEALVFESIEKRKIIPVLLPIQGEEKCGVWLIKEFIKYGDKPDMTLKMEGNICKEEVNEEQFFNCKEIEKGLNCINEKKKNITPLNKAQ
jgi:hypothetical protein